MANNLSIIMTKFEERNVQFQHDTLLETKHVLTLFSSMDK